MKLPNGSGSDLVALKAILKISRNSKGVDVANL